MGYEVEVLASNFDEDSIRCDDPSDLALMLANAKADTLLPEITVPAILVTADLIVVWKGQIKEKALDATQARQFLRECSQANAWCHRGMPRPD